MQDNESRLKELARGEELFSQGDLEAAKECFLKLAEGPDPSKEAHNNLGVIAHQEGDLDEALRCFTEALLIDSSYEDAVVNYRALLDEIERSQAEQEGGQASPDHDEPYGSQGPYSAEELSQPERKARIAVLCLPGLENFLGEIVSFLENRYEVRTCYSRDGAELASAVEWADLVWLEWANELAATLTCREGLLDGKRVICRVHSYEVLEGHLSRINWSKVTRTIFVASHVLDIARRMYPKMLDATKAVVISNGINLDKFSFKEREPGFNLAVVGHVNHKKNPSVWPEILYRLVSIDDRYSLKIAGAVQEPRYAFYLEHAFNKLGLDKKVRFFGHTKNIVSWFESESINYLLTTSVFESFGYGIAEAMSMGYRPLINNFPGSEDLWPEECCFSSIEEVVYMVQDTENYDSSMYRSFVTERYSLEKQLKELELMVNQVLGLTNDAVISHIIGFTYKSFEIKLYLPYINDHIRRVIIASDSFYEIGMLEDIKERVDEDNVIIDVGANVGNHTVFFSKICKAKHVYSFEPQKNMYDILKRNVEINNVKDKVKIYNMGVGKEKYNASINVVDCHNYGMSKIEKAINGDIKVDALDNILLKKINKIDVIKIDVEGMGLDVLEGAKKIIEKFRPYIYIEIDHKNESIPIMSYLMQHNYIPIAKFNATPTYLFIHMAH